MEFNWRYKNTLSNVFVTADTAFSGDVYNIDSTLSNHNVFNKLFVVDTSSDEMEIPAFARWAVERIVKEKLLPTNPAPVDKIVIPLYNGGINRTRKTADTIVGDFFSGTNFSQRLSKCTTSKGEIYYGGRGIILDASFNVLLLCTLLCRRKQSQDGEVMSYYKTAVHVSPQIFLDNNGLIPKSILKKVIPFYLSYPSSNISCGGRFRSEIPTDAKPQIIIDDANKFVVSPAVPTPQKCSDAILNQLIIDNEDEIMQQL